jgi:hypothetical protein
MEDERMGATNEELILSEVASIEEILEKEPYLAFKSNGSLIFLQ